MPSLRSTSTPLLSPALVSKCRPRAAAERHGRRGLLRHGRGRRLGLAVTVILDRDLLAGLEPRDPGAQVLGGRHVPAVDAGDHILGLEARFFRRAALNGFDHQHALALDAQVAGRVGGELLDEDAEVTAGDVAGLDELADDAVDHVDRDGEAQAVVRAGGTGDGGVHADDLAVDVAERAAGVAGVDRRVGLDEVFIALGACLTGLRVMLDVHDAELPPLGGDDALAHRELEAERRAEGEDDVALLDGVFRQVGDRGGVEVAAGDFDHRHVGLGVGGHDGRVTLGAVLEAAR